MASVKNFGLDGIAGTVQLGKAGPHLTANGGALAARDADNAALIKIKAAEAVNPDEVVTLSQLNAVAAGTSDGFVIPLGDVTTKGDGSWTPGAVALSNSMKVSDAIDGLNEVLSLLIPAQPPAFPNGALAVAGVGASPVLASGAVPNATGDALPSAGTAVTRIASATVSSAGAFNDVGPGKEGTIALLIDGAAVGSRTLTGTNDNGSYNGLVIADQKDYPAATPGFWKSVDVSVSGAAVPATGYHKMQMSDTAAGSTNTVYFVRDGLTAAPAVSGTAVTPDSGGTIAHSSSVPHFGSGGTVKVDLSINNLAGETYYGGADPLVVSGTNGVVAPQSFTYAALGIATPIARNTIAATAVGPLTISVNATNVHNAGVLQAVAKNVNGASSATTLGSATLLVKNGATARVDEMSIPVSGLGSLPNANNGARAAIASGGDTPAGAAGAWNGAAALPAYEAAVVAGVLAHDQTDYSTGYLPAGPNLSVGRSGAQYVTVAFQRSAVSKFTLNVTGSYAGCWVKLPGVSDNAGVSPNAANGWWDAAKPYDGAGVPGETGDSLAGCALGTPMSGSGAFVLTFGTQTSSNSAGNTILVRFKLIAGQSITALSVSA